MVGQGDVPEVSQVLSDKRLDVILQRALGKTWKVQECKLKTAAEGLTGFLGDHFRLALTAKDTDTGRTETLHLFVKSLPLSNKSKADFIDSNNFNRREMVMFKLFEEFEGDDGPNQWRPKAYFCDETVIVMPDLAKEGFATRHFSDTLSLSDVLLAAGSVARFHAAFCNYATKRSTTSKPYNILDEYGDIIEEPVLCDSPWLRAAAKLSANILNTFSTKYKGSIPNLEPKMLDLFLQSCDSFRYYENTVNAIVHRDLWVNNIMFAPGKTVLVDYQCIRYGPPAFDLMVLLCMCTTREFRDKHEREVFLHYYSVFCKSLDAPTADRVKEMGYNEAEFLRWCEQSRMFGLFYSLCIFPYTLMDPASAQKHFDDPDTFHRYCNEDRTEPVFLHGKSCKAYLDRQIQSTEEFVERYLMNKLE